MSAAPRRPVHAVPWPLVPVAVLAVAVVAGPPVALLAAVPWPRLGGLLGDAESLTALRLSVTTALLSTVLCVLLGVPLSLWLRDLLLRRPRVARAVQAVVFAPLVLSPVVSGLALVFLWGRRGVLGGWLDAHGVPVAYTTTGVVVVQVFVSLPFLVATTLTAVQAVPVRLEEAAATEGATRWQVVRHILLPLALPGIVTGAVLSFARSLSEYGATLTFAGNVAGRSRTVPLLIDLGLSSDDMDRALGGSVMLIGVYVMVVAGLAGVRWIAVARRGATSGTVGR
ncbi:ABC transporter permease subunit [Corynebacterium bovis]|uniref:molybdate ABC transporter permease subunit n=1 Tax=Corynebacterium bovis TaxID=36808 RepID=UPI0024477A70|nr:ABC transporter permease subunit [Corynebacterium bovis]MDH2455671.1 ABC transporter permease subunit [Corynebacterium bovis]